MHNRISLDTTLEGDHWTVRLLRQQIRRVVIDRKHWTTAAGGVLYVPGLLAMAHLVLSPSSCWILCLQKPKHFFHRQRIFMNSL